MDSTLGSTIEKIKREEQNKEAKLKARRELEAAKASSERSLREIISQTKKLQQDKEELVKRTDELGAHVAIQKIRRDALLSQFTFSKKELAKLRIKYDLAISEVQDLRSDFCKAVYELSDECDIWSLLTKPSTEALPRVITKKPLETNEQALINECRLKSALERRRKAITERDRLKSEPETGEEFIRIKNALRYSLEMTANLRK